MSANVAIFWDYENCEIPALEPSYAIVNGIRRLAHQYGSVTSFKAYLEYPEQVSLKSLALRSELQSCGVSLIDCPHNGRKDVADKMMMVDMMAHAIDTPAPSTIILISGDRDFVYAVSILSLRRYRVVLLAPRAAHSSLKAQANVVYSWPEDFLPDLPPSTDPEIGTASSMCPGFMRGSPPTSDDFWRTQGRCVTPTVSVSNDPLSEASTLDREWGGGDFGNQSRKTESVQASVSNEGNSEQLTFHLSKPEEGLLSSVKNAPTTEGVISPNAERPSVAEKKDVTATGPATWASVARLPKGEGARGTSPILRRIVPLAKEWLSPTISSPAPARNTSSIETTNIAHHDADGSDWQTYTRAANKLPMLATEFKPLVKVLKRQLAEGIVQVESSQLGQFLSQEVPRLASIYERAGVTRLKEYTAVAAEQGIVTLTREGVDGHNYVALHPAYRRKAATLA